MAHEENHFLHREGSSSTLYDNIPIGTFIWWFGTESTIPSGWLKMNGQSFGETEYPELYEVLGRTVLPQTSISPADVPAIPIIKAGIRHQSYTNQEIDSLFSSIENRILTLENNAATLGEDPLSDHNVDPNAHSSQMSVKASISSVENLISTLDDISDRLTLLEAGNSGEDDYTDEEIDTIFDSLESSVAQIESNATSLGQSYNSHLTDSNAHNNIMSTKADITDVNQLADDIDALGITN